MVREAERVERRALQHAIPESGRAPGPPAGLGSFFSHRITALSSIGTPWESLIRGVDTEFRNW